MPRRGEPVPPQTDRFVYDARKHGYASWVYDSAARKMHRPCFGRPLARGGGWRQIEPTGSAAIGREAVYIPRHDTVLWLGRKQLCAFDCTANRMAEVDVELPKGLYGHECAMVYDPKHDVCVALIPASFSGPMQTFLYRFDRKTARYKRASRP